MVKLNMECYATKKELPETIRFEMRIGGSFREDLTHEMLPELSVKGWMIGVCQVDKKVI